MTYFLWFTYRLLSNLRVLLLDYLSFYLYSKIIIKNLERCYIFIKRHLNILVDCL